MPHPSDTSVESLAELAWGIIAARAGVDHTWPPRNPGWADGLREAVSAIRERVSPGTSGAPERVHSGTQTYVSVELCLAQIREATPDHEQAEALCQRILAAVR